MLECYVRCVLKTLPTGNSLFCDKETVPMFHDTLNIISMGYLTNKIIDLQIRAFNNIPYM